MITAKEARDKVNDLTIERNKKQIEICEAKINEAVNGTHGAYAVTIEISLTTAVKLYLEELGYKVEYNSHRNESYTTIRW